MLNLYNTEAAPELENTFIDALVGDTIFSPGARIWYILEGRGSNDAEGGSRWRSDGAADAYQSALNAWLDVTNLNVVPYPFFHTEGDDPGNIGQNYWLTRLTFTGDSPVLGFHERPGDFSVQEGGYNNQSSIFTRESNAPGGLSYVSFLNLIGTAMGLTNPHGNGTFPGVTEGILGWLDTGDFGLNQGIFTVMSFVRGFDEKGQSPSDNYGWQATPGAFDIAAVQAIYGANTSSNTGSDVYVIPTINAAGTFYSTIWDVRGTDTISAELALIPTTIDLRAATLQNEEGGGGWLSSAEGIFGGFTIANGVVIENAIGGFSSDVITGNDAANRITGGRGDDVIDGGANVDTAIFEGNFTEYTITQPSSGVFEISGLDGTDTLTNVEIFRFDDLDLQLDSGDGLTIDPGSDNPDSFMINIRDFDGNDLGAAFDWVRIGEADANLDGSVDYIFVNRVNGRFAEVGVDENGLVQFDDYGQGGDTRVVGIYIDPEVVAGNVEQGSPFDSQQRFQNDLFIGNIAEVLGSQDYDGDGFAEIYFALTDGTAYLRALMHADGNIQYANYQSEEQVIEYLSSLGYGEETFGDWFGDDQSAQSADALQNAASDVTILPAPAMTMGVEFGVMAEMYG